MEERTAYRFGPFTLDPGFACLRRDGNAIPLRPKSFEVLVYLVRNRGRPIPKSELFDNVWQGVIVTDNSLVQCIKDIRQALDDDDQTIIETVAKRGYLFSQAVDEFDPAILVEAAVLPNIETSPATEASPSTTLRRKRLVAAAIGGLMVALAAVGAWQWFWPSSNTRNIAIAVMPFGSADAAGDNYFTTGMSEDVATALGRFPNLSVASPKVVSHFRHIGLSAEDIERQLKVGYFVEGNVRRTPDTMRITVRLTDMQHKVLVWSHVYDVMNPMILAVQDEIALHIAGALSVRVTNLERKRAANKSAPSMEAYDFVLRGREFLSRLNRTSHSQARAMFERAIALDANYAAAYIGLGRVDLSAVAMGWTSNAPEVLDRAESLARKVLSIDEFNPSAHVLLGRTYVRMGQYGRALESLQRAVSLNPSDPDSYAGLGDALLWSGDTAGAIKALETATSMDPGLSAEDLFSLGAAYFMSGRTSDSMQVFERATNRNEGNAFIFAMLAAVSAESGRDVEARAAAVTVRQLNPFFDVENFGTLFKDLQQREKLTNALRKAGL